MKAVKVKLVPSAERDRVVITLRRDLVKPLMDALGELPSDDPTDQIYDAIGEAVSWDYS